MDGITIHIGWEYFLGIIAALLGVAWYTNGRFTALETSMQWVRDILSDLKTASDNVITPAFGSRSPVNLNATGEEWLVDSGLKDYLDTHKDELIEMCEEKRDTNPYEVQKHIFRVFDTLVFEDNFEDELKKFAFEKGATMNIVRRVGAIYFRNLCLAKFGMNKDDIDRHDPEKS
jgi:hypothetical protein